MPEHHARDVPAAGAEPINVAGAEAFDVKVGQLYSGGVQPLADDLGAKELSSYGSKRHSTPNLDRLAVRPLPLSIRAFLRQKCQKRKELRLSFWHHQPIIDRN